MDVSLGTPLTLGRDPAALVAARSGTGGGRSVVSDATLRAQAREFESVFLSTMLKPAFDTVESDEYFGGGQAEETWRGLLVETYANNIASGSGIGVAEAVYKELLAMQAAQAQ